MKNSESFYKALSQKKPVWLGGQLTRSMLLPIVTYKKVLFRENTAMLMWYDDRDRPLFGSKYYPLTSLPSFIKRMMP